MKYLLDTNIAIALLKGQDDGLVKKMRFHTPQDFCLCSVVKAELFFGARNSQKISSNLALLDQFFMQFESLPFDDVAAEHYGMIRALLSRSGTPIGAHDLEIASIAQSRDLTILTRNHKEFVRVPGLRVETW